MSRKNLRKKKKTRHGIVTIDDLASNARGVGHSDDGKAIFVAGALPGEQVVYRPTKRKRHYEEGNLETLLSASPERISPKCPHFWVCGGCALQHLSAEAQVQFKQQQMLDALARVGHVKPAHVLEPITDELWNYRRRARLGVKFVEKKGRALVGFRERGAPYIADLGRCDTLVASVGNKIKELSALVGQLSIKNKVPQIEVAEADNAVALVFRVLAKPSKKDLDLLREFAHEHQFTLYLQPGNASTIRSLEPNTPDLYYELPDFDVRLNFLPSDFIQIHAGVNKKMVKQAVNLLDIQPQDRVLELFAGLGNFTLPIARHAAQVVTVEGEASLVKRAAANAELNGLNNIETHVADLFKPKADASWLQTHYDTVLLDPPRSGAAEIIPFVVKKKPRKIVYCSCHPATLARDAGELVNTYGYKLTHAGIMDMFPHTAHIESMAVFEL